MTAASWSFTAAPEAPGLVREVVRAFAADHGADAETLAGIELCVTEAVSNVVVHAYRDRGQPGDVHVEAEHLDGRLSLYVRDEGDGLQPRVDSPGRGLGLPIIAQTSGSFEVRAPRHGGTELVMHFELTTASGSNLSQSRAGPRGDG